MPTDVLELYEGPQRPGKKERFSAINEDVMPVYGTQLMSVMSATSPQLGAKRNSIGRHPKSRFDPRRTLFGPMRHGG